MLKHTQKEYVYILATKNGNSYKIGKANNVLIRMEQLNKHWDFDIEESYVIETEYDNSYNIERILHRVLRNYRIKNNDKKDGYTEFFSYRGLGLIFQTIEFLKTAYKLNRITLLQHIKNEEEKDSSNILNSILHINAYDTYSFDSLIKIIEEFKYNINNLLTLDNNQYYTISINNELLKKRDLGLDKEKTFFKEFIENPFLDNTTKFAELLSFDKKYITVKINKDFIDNEKFKFLYLCNFSKLYKFKNLQSKKFFLSLSQLKCLKTININISTNMFEKIIGDNIFFDKRALKNIKNEMKEIANLNVNFHEDFKKILIEIEKPEVEIKICNTNNIDISSKLMSIKTSKELNTFINNWAKS